jgi:hypothetical protein
VKYTSSRWLIVARSQSTEPSSAECKAAGSIDGSLKNDVSPPTVHRGVPRPLGCRRPEQT